MVLKKIFKKLFLLLPLFLLIALIIIVFNFDKVKTVITRAFYTKANIIVNAVQPAEKHFIPNWLCLAQGGEEPGKNMIAATTKKVGAIKPPYIRIDHIFDDDYYGVVQTGTQGTWYDFTRLDQTVDSILATGAKPMLVLSYMPQAVADQKTDLPYNWAEWQKLVSSTIQHYSGTKGKNISNVYYEVWNEPDLESFGAFKYYGEKNYLTLYWHTAKAAQQIRWANPFKIGGPSTTDLYENWVKTLATFCQENKLPLGFISYHQYSFYPDKYDENVQKLKSWLMDYPQYKNIEVLLTEWGPDSEKNPVYNTAFAAAFSLATISKVADQVDKAFAFEIKDGPQTNSWGMIAHEDQNLWTKPRYQLFGWLAELKQTLSVMGNGTYVKAVAGKKDNSTVVILTNYDPQSKHQEVVPIRVTNLKPGRYQLKRQYLLQKPIYEDITLSSSVFSRQIYLSPNTVYKLELISL